MNGSGNTVLALYEFNEVQRNEGKDQSTLIDTEYDDGIPWGNQSPCEMLERILFATLPAKSSYYMEGRSIESSSNFLSASRQSFLTVCFTIPQLCIHGTFQYLIKANLIATLTLSKLVIFDRFRMPASF